MSSLSGAETLTQAQRIARVLLKLELMAHGAVQAWNPSGGQSGEPDDRFVAIVARCDQPEYLEFRVRYNCARSDRGRDEVIQEAEDTYASMVKRQKPAPANLKTFEQLVLEDGEGHDADVVAARYAVAVALIRRIRVRASRDPETGRTAVEAALSRSEQAQRARELRARGCSTREIAASLGVSQTLVMRFIRECGGKA